MSRTDESGARSRSDAVSVEAMPISDRTSPDFINLANPVKLARNQCRPTLDAIDPTWRLAVPPPHVAPAAGRHCHSDAADRRSAPVAVPGRRGRRRHGRRRTDSALGRAPHRRHLADAQRAAGSARRHRPVRAAPQPALRRQHRALGRIRADRAADLAGAGDSRAARARVPRDRAVGGDAAGVAPGPGLPRLRRARAAMDPDLQPAADRGERGLRRQREGFSWRATLFSERGTFVAMALGYLLLWTKARF